ncbi:hypothetical protein ABH14_06210 [Brevibacillus brevis]|uniref:hypothetical protein n=1 Tax=Brevibacillus brevis TaxID=1393 RepID=UPI001F5B47F7|nr:hypothetical protein [Brevibacillus brevis]MBH0329400.1 hypothetical protein [Brevibacillus brevis]
MPIRLTIGWIDALTGKVIGEEAELAGEGVLVKRKTEQKISVEEAKKKEIAALVPYLDPALTELSLIVETPEEDIPEWVDKNKLDKEEDNAYSFTFLGKRNGVEVSDESYMVGVDKATGTIAELNLHPSQPAHYPSRFKEDCKCSRSKRNDQTRN